MRPQASIRRQLSRQTAALTEYKSIAASDLRARGQSVTVVELVAGLPAAASGLIAVNDVLLSVDGTGVEGWALPQVALGLAHALRASTSMLLVRSQHLNPCGSIMALVTAGSPITMRRVPPWRRGRERRRCFPRSTARRARQ